MKIFKECTQFCMFNIHNFLNNIQYFVNATYSIFSCMVVFLNKICTFNIQTFEKWTQFCISTFKIFQRMYTFYTFNIHDCKKKNVHNFVYSKYTKFQRIYIILFIQWTQIFKEYTQLCTFNVYFQRMYIICMFIVHFFFFFL